MGIFYYSLKLSNLKIIPVFYIKLIFNLKDYTEFKHSV
jgi:hypothetical protein